MPAHDRLLLGFPFSPLVRSLCLPHVFPEFQLKRSVDDDYPASSYPGIGASVFSPLALAPS